MMSELVARVNMARARAGRAVVIRSTDLDADAQRCVESMAATGEFSQDPEQNVAFGYFSAASVADAWLSSAHGRKNILEPEHRHAGAGFVASDGWWCLRFTD